MEQKKKQHPHDPREDLIGDNDLWKELLKRFWKLNKQVYYNFHGLRCGGSHLKLIDGNLEFSFGDTFENDKILNEIKKKYLDPHKDIIQIVMKKLAKDLSSDRVTLFDEEKVPF